MTIRIRGTLCAIAACACTTFTADLLAQARGARSGAPGPGRATAVAAPPAAVNAADDPFSGPVVTNAPFSADAITTVTQVLSDGTRIEENTTARFYRDSTGRIRREQAILGLAALNPSGEPRMTITVDPDPNDATAYTLDPVNKTARQVSRAAAPAVMRFYTRDGREGGATAAYVAYGDTLSTRRVRINGQEITDVSGVKQPDEALGTRQIEGVTAVGRRMKSIIPIGQIGNDRPIEITDERWESAELRLLIRSHHHDPRTGDVEYRLTNIVRVDPPPDLFTIPSDYTLSASGDVIILSEPGVRVGGAGAGARGGGGARTGGQRTGGPAGN